MDIVEKTDDGWEYFERVLHSDPGGLLKGELRPLDFPLHARELGFDTIELLNPFFFDKAEDRRFWADLRSRCEGEGVRCHMLAVGWEGNVANPETKQRDVAIANHARWMSMAEYLGCESITANASGRRGNAEDYRLAAIDGLARLCEAAAKANLRVLVENHGGYSSNPGWLFSVIREVNSPHCGVLLDTGNFCFRWRQTPDGTGLECIDGFDPYESISILLPLAGGVTAKFFGFSDAGEDIRLDYRRIIRSIVGSEFDGYVGIEYAGETHPESAGIGLGKTLLDKTIREISAEPHTPEKK